MVSVCIHALQIHIATLIDFIDICGSFETKGSVIDGLFIPTEPDRTAESNCPNDVFFWPKGVPTPTPTSTPMSSAPTPVRFIISP